VFVVRLANIASHRHLRSITSDIGTLSYRVYAKRFEGRMGRSHMKRSAVRRFNLCTYMYV
jgi:hypothetical protein